MPVKAHYEFLTATLNKDATLLPPTKQWWSQSVPDAGAAILWWWCHQERSSLHSSDWRVGVLVSWSRPHSRLSSVCCRSWCYNLVYTRITEHQHENNQKKQENRKCITYSAAEHQGATEMFWLCSWGAFNPLITSVFNRQKTQTTFILLPVFQHVCSGFARWRFETVCCINSGLCGRNIIESFFYSPYYRLICVRCLFK